MATETDYPATYKPATHGSITGKLIELRAVKTTDMATGEPVDKVVAEIEVTEKTDTVAEGERLSVFLEGVLWTKFQDEAQRRKRVGKEGFEPEEGITLDYLGKKKSGNGFQYHNYVVTFEHAVPGSGAFDLLTAQEAPPTEPEPAPADMPTTPVADEDIPFS